MNKMFYGLHPPTINNLYIKNCDVHNHNTRHRNYILLHIVTCMPKVFYCSSILIWNGIRNKIEVPDSFPQFKILLIHYLLEIINGRPYGGLAILIRKQYEPICDFQSFDDSMLLSVTMSSFVEKTLFH